MLLLPVSGDDTKLGSYVLTDGKCNGMLGAIVHVPSGADVEVFLKKESARSQARGCCTLITFAALD